MYSLNGFPGLLRIGVIQSYSEDNISVDVILNSPLSSSKQIITAQLPIAMYSPSGVFAGTFPEAGTNVIIGQAEGGSWYIIGVLAKDQNSKSISKLNKVPSLSKGDIVFQTSNTQITLDKNDGIQIGSIKNNILIDHSRGILAEDLETKISLTEASRYVEGVIKRDVKPNINLSPLMKEISPKFDDSLKIIGMDPTASTGISNVIGSVKNPPFIEKREVIFEFANSYNILSDNDELSLYKTDGEFPQTNNNIINRRKSRADALSLSLVAPNYLMETIKGTVVDIYGNILDINRSIIPIGQNDAISIKKVKDTSNLTDEASVFAQIKRLERNSIAYHFELNAKKELTGAPDPNDTSNYSRSRSRFFVDINKEGLLKVNVPSSSETGSIPFLTRFENFSTINPNPATNDPNDLVFNQDQTDILIDSFANGVITISDQLGIDGFSAPKDRFSDGNVHIKHGTVFHNILDIGAAYKTQPIEYIASTNIGQFTSDYINKTGGNLGSDNIIISGTNANAGGRSGSFNLDGSLEINIGANSVDRSSMWIDLAGGSTMKMGRDKNDTSLNMQADGDIYLQVGGKAVNGDDRFTSNEYRAGSFDLRVQNNNEGEYSIIHIDKTGISIFSPGRLTVNTNQDILLRSSGTMNIEAEQLYLNRRKVKKYGQSI